MVRIVLFLFLVNISITSFAESNEGYAFRFFQQNKWKEATALYQEFLNTNDYLSTTEQYARAIVASAMSQDSRSLFSFIRKYKEHSGEESDLLREIDDALVMSKKESLLEPVFNYICKNDYNYFPLVKEYIVQKYWANNEYEEVLRILKQMKSEYESDMHLNLTIAKLELLMGRTDEALNEVNQILLKDPSNFSANLFMGNYYFIRGRAMMDEIKTQFVSRRFNTKKSDLIDFQQKIKRVIIDFLDNAGYYLSRANQEQSNEFIRSNLKWIEEMKKENTRIMMKLRIDEEEK
ncbi:MAG: tetratricopeptide repeat protein [Bacteroidales bacterium]